MKKIIALILIVAGVSAFALGKDSETMTWAEYEIQCEKNGVVADWNDYTKLQPQCFGDDVETVINLFQGADND